VAVLKSNDIAAGDLVPVEVDGLALLIAADLDGKIFAIANSCPHLGTPLENGRLGEGSTIVCPLHKSAFSLETGDVVGDWCPFPPILGPLILGNLAPPEKVSTFPVRAKGNNIEVFVDRNLKERFESKYWSGLLDAQGKATGEFSVRVVFLLAPHRPASPKLTLTPFHSLNTTRRVLLKARPRKACLRVPFGVHPKALTKMPRVAPQR